MISSPMCVMMLEKLRNALNLELLASLNAHSSYYLSAMHVCHCMFVREDNIVLVYRKRIMYCILVLVTSKHFVRFMHVLD